MHQTVMQQEKTLADIVTMNGDGLTASSGAFNVSVDDSSIETSSDALRVNKWYH